MPYLPTVPPEEATGEVKDMYDKDLAQHGYVANYTRAFSVRPDVETVWLALKDAITSSMDPRLYELATVASSRLSTTRPTLSCASRRRTPAMR
jgi:hypothetical protein